MHTGMNPAAGEGISTVTNRGGYLPTLVKRARTKPTNRMVARKVNSRHPSGSLASLKHARARVHVSLRRRTAVAKSLRKRRVVSSRIMANQGAWVAVQTKFSAGLTEGVPRWFLCRRCYTASPAASKHGYTIVSNANLVGDAENMPRCALCRASAPAKAKCARQLTFPQ